MKRILWIVSELFPPDETSTAYILGEVANAMAGKYTVKVICGPEIYDIRKKPDPQNQFKLNPNIEVLRVSTLGVDKNTVKGKIESILSSSIKLSREVKRKVKKEDKVLMVTNPFPLIVFMARLKKKIGFELNVLVHDVFPENAKPSNIYVPCEFLVKRIFDRAYANVDVLIALGRDMKKVLTAKVRSAKTPPRIDIIENWADTDTIRPLGNSISEKIVVEYAGNIGRGQGIKYFIDIFNEVNRPFLQFDLYGTGALENFLKKNVVDQRIENIFFHGPYFRSQQCEVLNSCDIALVTLSEGLYGLGVPSKTYNIMAAGKAILFIGHPESEIALMIKEKSIGFVFAPSDKKGISEFLDSLMDLNKHQLKEMGERSRQVAEEEYSKEIILEKFMRAI